MATVKKDKQSESVSRQSEYEGHEPTPSMSQMHNNYLADGVPAQLRSGGIGAIGVALFAVNFTADWLYITISAGIGAMVGMLCGRLEYRRRNNY